MNQIIVDSVSHIYYKAMLKKTTTVEYRVCSFHQCLFRIFILRRIRKQYVDKSGEGKKLIL
jgi:hypothetical protein